MAREIEEMRVRGAGKIARHAVAALAAWGGAFDGDRAAFEAQFADARDRLLATRPTAVSLRNGLAFVERRVRRASSLKEKLDALQHASKEFQERSVAAVAAIGRHGVPLIREGGAYLTHCNSQAALSVFKAAHEQGRTFRVIATESRPWRQGHLTARELAAAGIDVTLVVDSAAQHVMPGVDGVLLGCDTVAANGDVINKIGTSTLALLAQTAGKPFHVCGETYKVDLGTPSGAEVVIEEREVTEIAEPSDFPGVKFLNPVFDVTPAARVEGLVTEVGVVAPRDVSAVARKVWEG